MPSVFEDTTMKLVKNIGDSELRPVRCLLDATKIRLFSLIRRNKSRSLFWKPPDVPLDVSLMHVLDPSAPVPDAAEKMLFRFRNIEVKQHLAAGSVAAGPGVSLSGETAEGRGVLLECQIVTHRNATWEDLQQRKLRDPEPGVLKQCRAAGGNLYVVTETVELVKGCVLEDCHSADFRGRFSFTWNMFVKINKEAEDSEQQDVDKTEGQAGGRKVSRRELTVPEASVLAYKRRQLVFVENTWGILLFMDDDKQETFPEVTRQGSEEHFFLIDFRCLHQEVSEMVRVAQDLKGIQDVVFSSIRAMLGDREALQDLMDMLEQRPLGHMNGPGGTILNELRKDSSFSQAKSVHLVLYLLEAIMALSDIQHDLLAQSMDGKILVQQRGLVRSILEPNFKCCQRIPFRLQPELLAPLQGENLAITYGLLNECGLKMELGRPWTTWDPDAKEPLCALYGTLSVLQQLVEA